MMAMGILVLFLILAGKAFNFIPLSVMLAVGLSHMAFIMLRNNASILNLLVWNRSFHTKSYLILSWKDAEFYQRPNVLLSLKVWPSKKHVITFAHIPLVAHAFLRDIMGSVSDYCNKVNIAKLKKRASHMNFFGFPVHIKVMFTLYCNLLSVQ